MYILHDRHIVHDPCITRSIKPNGLYTPEWQYHSERENMLVRAAEQIYFARHGQPGQHLFYFSTSTLLRKSLNRHSLGLFNFIFTRVLMKIFVMVTKNYLKSSNTLIKDIIISMRLLVIIIKKNNNGRHLLMRYGELCVNTAAVCCKWASAS